jgi:two-component system, OmpR family, sensor histidine kinase VanS
VSATASRVRVNRAPGPSVRLRLALSYAGFLMLAGTLLLGGVWVFVLRYLDDDLVFRTTGWLYVQSDPLNGFGPPAVVLLLFLLAFGLGGGWLLAGRMLAPLDRIGDATRLAATGSLTHRIRLEGRDDEFRELADSFDAMLARLEAHVAEQQRFAANASHELRTPLAITRTLLEVARSDPARADEELLERLHAVNGRAIELTEALLLLSRADRRAFAREEVDLSLVAEEAAETLLPLAETRGVEVAVSGDVAVVLGSRALLLQLATNLVHNAIVHNLPAGGTVDVRTTATSVGHAALTVANTGPVLTPELVGTLVEPFRRGADRVRSEDGGVGLGLAIARSITEAHDGTLGLASRDGGGLRVEVQLPADRP